MTPSAKAQTIKTIAHDTGFDLVGITRADPARRAAYYRDWLAAGYGGTMRYLARNVHLRADPARLLPGAQAIICVAVSCKRADGYERPGPPASNDGQADRPRPALTGRIAQYARGHDYHRILQGMLGTLLQRLRARFTEPFDTRVFVDSGPVLERELAAAAGLGWIGRNTCLLNGRLGSHLLLGEIITTLDLAPDDPVADRCGSCTRCVDTCPTGALGAPYQLDASRCIAYLTIEHRGPIPEEFHVALGDRVFGCDLCQQVCPYNRRAPLGTQPDIAADVTPAEMDLLPLLRLRSGEYRRLTRDSALARTRRNMWRRNAAIALGNCGCGSAAVRDALQAAGSDEDPGVRSAAAGSLARLAGKD